MKLTTKAIEAITPRSAVLALALALGFTEVWIVKLIAANKPDGPLTTATALNVIREETGLLDTEMLEESVEPTKVAP